MQIALPVRRHSLRLNDIQRNMARYHLRAAGVRRINRKGADGKSFFALYWREWVQPKRRRLSLIDKFRRWWFLLKYRRAIKRFERKRKAVVMRRESMIRRDQRFREKHRKDRDAAMAAAKGAAP